MTVAPEFMLHAKAPTSRGKYGATSPFLCARAHTTTFYGQVQSALKSVLRVPRDIHLPFLLAASAAILIFQVRKTTEQHLGYLHALLAWTARLTKAVQSIHKLQSLSPPYFASLVISQASFGGVFFFLI